MIGRPFRVVLYLIDLSNPNEKWQPNTRINDTK